MLRNYIYAALLAGATLAATPALAQSSPAVGSWATEAVTDFGTFKATLNITQNGSGYAVQFVDEPGPDGAAPPASTISDVTVDGANFSFKRTIDFQGQAIVLTYTGSVDGNALTATANSDFGAIPVKGTRN